MAFSEIASKVIQQKRTFLNFVRLYVLYQFSVQLPKDSIVVEVGTYKGGSIKFISDVLGAQSRDTKLYACDTFSGHATVDPKFDGTHNVNSGFTDVLYEDVQEYLIDCPNIEVLSGDIRNTWKLIPVDKQIGLLHLDVDVYPITKFCLELFSHRMARGGVIVCDDYGFTTCAGVKVAVDEFCSSNPDWKLLHLLTGQAILLNSSFS